MSALSLLHRDEQTLTVPEAGIKVLATMLAFAVVWTIGQNLIDVARWRFVSDVPRALPGLQ